MDEALSIARQIAEALEAAHEQGIVHRDLKPANVKLRADGMVKVLDFGLAKMLGPAEAGHYQAGAAEAGREAGIDLNSPTVTSPAMTRMGVILGTAAYMSPEQARGRAADKRSDVWAFGCVLFEMLTGRRAFDGEEVSDTLASVLKGEPDWNVLPAETPLSIRTFLKACLAKDRRQRIADISAALFVIDHQASLVPAVDAPIRPATPQRVPLWRRAIPAAAIVFVGIAAGYGAWTLKPEAARVVTRFTIALSERDQFTGTDRHLVALSPDGTRLVYAANNRLYLRALDQLEASTIPGVEERSYSYFGSLLGLVPSFLRTYDVAPDGRRFLMIKNSDVPDRPSTAPRIVIVQNWFEELKRRVPAK